MKNRQFFVYILANKKHGTLYIGVTNNLTRRILEHKKGFVDGFTKKYKIHRLVYYESSENPVSAIEREKQLKAWHRNWKTNLIKENNPEWEDLSNTLDPETSSG